MKTRNKLKIMGLLLTLVMLVTMLGSFGITAFAAEGDACASTTDCTGTYANGVCSVCRGYQPAVDSDNDSYYEISNAGQLFWFAEQINSEAIANTSNAVLTADIDLENKAWTPIGIQNEAVSPNVKVPYKGIFDGQNHIIRNLNVLVTDGREAGLFGRAQSATLKNFGVENATVISDPVNGNSYRAGIIAGELHQCTITNVYSVGSLTITTEHAQKGGIAGECASTTLTNCYTTYGMLTTNNTTTATNCYYMANEANANSVGEHVTKAQFVSGYVAYLLGEGWGQTLTGDDRQEYPVLGGTQVTATERFEVYGQQLNLGADLSMKYYVAAYAVNSDLTAMTMKFIHNGVVTVLTADPTNMKDGFYVFTLTGINPQCMGDGIDAYLYYDGVQKAEKLGYTVEQNLKNLLKVYSDDTALVDLINATLAYGKAAGIYQNHDKIGDYTVADVTIPEASITLEAPFIGYTVRFGVMNYIKIDVTLTNGYRLYLNDTDITDKVAEDGTYTTAGIAPTDFATKYKFEVRESDGTTVVKELTLSVNDYLYVISQSSDYENMVKLAKALYNYGLSAHKYLDVHTADESVGQTCLGYQCVVCGVWYGDTDATKHASDEFTYTANEDGTTHTEKYKCCGTVVSANEEHTVTTWTQTDGKHTGNCDHCGAIVTEAHSGGTATCLVGKICEICGFEYEATNPNNHASDELTYTANEDETHSAVYSCCNALVYDYDKETNTYTVYSPVGLLAWGEAARAVISTGTEDTNNDWYAEYTTDMPNLTLAADITLTGENNWTPLGYVSEDKSTYYPYIGTIDGNGHTITGLNINSTGDYIAFVGSLGPNSEVKNLTFKDATIIGGENVATVAADCGGNVTNCHVTGSSSVSGNNQVAGVVAWNGAGIISGCTNAATVTVNVGDVSAGSGGVVGTNILNGIVIGCFNSGDITASGSNRSQICGGVVGLNTTESIIIACGNTGKVVSSVDGVGGIAGGNYGVPVYACWTKETTEFKSGTEVSNKDGVGTDQDNTSVLHACYSFADTSAVADAITAMNTAIDEYNASAAEGRKCTYKWQVGADGYPTLVEIDQTPTE